MTREELFRAVGEVREEQIEEAETVKRQVCPWRRYGALAACLALIVTAAAAAPWIEKQVKWGALIYSFNPGGEPVDAGTGAGGVDGSDYSTDAPAQPVRPSYSKNVEIGELSGPGDGEAMGGMSACVAWMPPEEIFAQDTAIFRGTIQELQYFQVAVDGIDVYYTRALAAVTDPIRGDLAEGDTVSLLWLGARGYLTTSLSGPLDGMEEGSDAIFMPTRTTPATGETGWGAEDSYFCYADLADYYLPEGNRYVFADTEEGLEFDRSLYTDLAEAETLEDLAALIREEIGAGQERSAKGWVVREEDPEFVWLEGSRSETAQPAADPAVPQAEPSETADAAPPSNSGPNGAREMRGGALAGDEKLGESP